MTDYPIKTGRPPHANAKYPFADLRKGQYFEFPADKYRSVSSRASEYGKKTGKKFTVRGYGDDIGRCYRVK